MTILKYVGTVGAAALLTTTVGSPAAAQSANAVLHDKSGKEVGTVDLSQTGAGVFLKLTLKGMPAGEHAFHIHAAAKCEPPAFTSGLRGGTIEGGSARKKSRGATACSCVQKPPRNRLTQVR